MRALPMVAALVGLSLIVGVAPGLLPGAEAHHNKPIQPGARMTAPFGCTMNFVFRDAAAQLYIGTAGHCVRAEGEAVRVSGVAEPIGSVVWKGIDVDFALVAIDPALQGLVSPSVRHWGGPTGVSKATPLRVSPDVIYHYGFGIGYGLSELTRPRAGLLTFQGPAFFLAETTATFGDSGSPIILDSGEALGVVSEFALTQAHTDRGPTVEYILAQAQVEKGLALSLETAPLKDPVARELERAKHRPLGSG